MLLTTRTQTTTGEGKPGQRAAALACTAGLVLALASDAGAQGTEYVYLIDTSGSMVGLPAGSGNANIFPAVKEELIRHLESLEPGDMLHVRTFDEGVRSAEVFSIGSDADRDRAEQYVLGLDARGQSTWVYQSIVNTARERARERSEASSADSRESPAIYFVYTDGLDNDPQGTDMRGMLEQFGEIKQENDFLFYVTLGVDLPEADKEALAGDDHARHLLVPEGEPPRIGVLQVRPAALHFGFVEGDLSNSRSVALRLSNVDTANVTLRFHSSFPEAEALGGVVDVEPATTDFGRYRDVRLRLVNRESFPDQTFEGSLSVSADQPHIQVVPDLVTATLSTVPLPAATVAVDPAGLDFGEAAVGAAAPEAISLRVEFGASARSGESGFYVETESSAPDETAVPTVAWNGRPVAGASQLLTSADRINELVVSWPETPADPGTFAGRVRLVPELLRLEGDPAWTLGDGSFTVPWSLQVRPAPMPLWQRVAIGFGAMAVVAVIAISAWWLSQPQLSGQLVYEPKGRASEHVHLQGRRPMSIGQGTEHLPDLPDRVVISPGRPSATAATTGDVLHQPAGTRSPYPLEGQPLDDGDTLIFGKRHEVLFWSS